MATGQTVKIIMIKDATLSIMSWSADIPNVGMPSVTVKLITLSVIILNVIMLNVVMLSVVSPKKAAFHFFKNRS
jgi:hypothetical protein